MADVILSRTDVMNWRLEFDGIECCHCLDHEVPYIFNMKEYIISGKKHVELAHKR